MTEVGGGKRKKREGRERRIKRPEGGTANWSVGVGHPTVNGSHPGECRSTGRSNPPIAWLTKTGIVWPASGDLFHGGLARSRLFSKDIGNIVSAYR